MEGTLEISSTRPKSPEVVDNVDDSTEIQRFGLPREEEADYDDSDAEESNEVPTIPMDRFKHEQSVFRLGKNVGMELEKPSKEFWDEHPPPQSLFRERGSYVSKLAPEKSKPSSTYYDHKKRKETETKEYITPSNPKKYKQQPLSFRPPSVSQSINVIAPREIEASGTEEVMDALVAGVATARGEEDVEDVDIWSAEQVLEHVKAALIRVARGKEPLLPRVQSDLFMLRNYCQLITKPLPHRKGRIDASLHVAEDFHDKLQGITLSRRIRSLFLYYREHHWLPEETRGGHRESSSLLDDENLFAACREWLSSQKKGGITPLSFQKAVNEHLLPRLLIVPKKGPISERTMRRWLPRLGYVRVTEKKGVYVDGHERDDVKAYRNKVFLPKHLEIDRLTTHYEEVDGKLVARLPELKPGEKRHIVLFHDESTIHSNDFKKHQYMEKGSTNPPGKSKGRPIHVSEFISTEGKLDLKDADGHIVERARTIIYPGKNHDEWWNLVQLREQLKKAIRIFDELHPNCVAVFIFDQSSAHQAMGDGALNAFAMNLDGGGKPTIQKDTYFPPEIAEDKMHLLGTPQILWEPMYDKKAKVFCFEEDGVTPKRQPKGIARILAERGIFPKKPDGKPLKAKCSPQCPDPLPDEPPLPPCCQARVLQNHSDFMEQQSFIAQLIEDAGHKCLFLPKFHCELNAIEMYWGYCKARYRNVLKKSFKDAKEQADIALDSCSVDTMRRFCNRSFRFMDAYRKGLSVEAASWCVRKQKGHRAISEGVMKLFDAQVKKP